MKIKNEEVAIKIGNKEHKFTNMILNSYLDLYANNLIDFKNKDLAYCLINFTKTNYDINENSTSMNYDLELEAELDKQVEILSEKSVTNKYYYKREVSGGNSIQDFLGKTIKNIGFANYDYNLNRYVIYAYIDVTKYNIIIQENQPLIISRIDKIESEMNMWSSSTLIKGPIHLTKRGILELNGYDYETIKPKLYSIGFGMLPYTINKEYLVKDLKITKSGTGILEIKNQLSTGYNKTLYFKDNLRMSNNLVLKKPNYRFLIYKFKLLKETYPDPHEEAVIIDTEKYYTQYKELTKFGNIDLKIKYERG